MVVSDRFPYVQALLEMIEPTDKYILRFRTRVQITNQQRVRMKVKEES